MAYVKYTDKNRDYLKKAFKKHAPRFKKVLEEKALAKVKSNESS